MQMQIALWLALPVPVKTAICMISSLLKLTTKANKNQWASFVARPRFDNAIISL
jgi:hypothetical protein